MNSTPQSIHAAQWFDGRSAAAVDAEVSIADGMLRGKAGERRVEIPLSDLRASAAVAGVPLRILLPDGGEFVLANAAVRPQALGLPAQQGLIHGLERNPVAVVLAVIAVAALCVLAYRFGIPRLAGEIANRVPIASEAKLGEAALSSLDGFVFAPTQLPAEQRATLQAYFDRLVERAQLRYTPQLVFRNGQRLIGQNALTLPGGTVVVTDQLVARLSPEEVAAVYAHELGHIAYRHSMRHLLEQSSSGLILGALLGDVSGIGSLVSAAPVALIRLTYSRGDEEEADDYALALLPQVGLSPALLADALEAISSPQCSNAGTAEGGGAEKCRRTRVGREPAPPSYLSTHPDTASRIARARAAAK